MKKLLLLLAVILLFCCGGKDQTLKSGLSDIEHTLKIRVKNKQYLNMAALLDTVHYVPLKSIKDFMIGRIDKLLCYAGFSFILDKHVTSSIFVFKNNGDMHYKISRKGMAPGEYNRLYDMEIDPYNQHLTLTAMNPNKRLVFDLLSGKYLKESAFQIKYSCQMAVTGTHNRIFFLNFIATTKQDDAYCLKSVKNGKIVNQFFPYESRYYHQLLMTPVFFRQGEARIDFIPYFQNIVYEVDQDSLRAKYRFDFGDKNLPADLFPREKKSNRYPDLLNKYCHAINHYQETKTHLHFSFSYNGLVYNAFVSKSPWSVQTGNRLFWPYRNLGFNAPIAVKDDWLVGFIPVNHFKNSHHPPFAPQRNNSTGRGF